MDGRIQKQLIIGLVFVLILIGISYGIYSSFAPEVSCVDGIKNGQEGGVDCGTLACGIICPVPVQAPQVKSIQRIYVPDTDGTSDVVIQIYNPNTEYGVASGVYDLVIKDSSGVELDRLSGQQFYMLPGQTKYLVLTVVKGLALGEESVEIKNVQWEKLDMPNNIVNFILRRKDYHFIQKGTELTAVMYNDSNYDFDKIDIAVILFDDTDNIVGVNKTDIRTFVSKTERGFNVVWPFVLPGNVVRQDVEASTNLFENSNFIKSYGSQEKFQKFY